jgi:hypothetical protein
MELVSHNLLLLAIDLAVRQHWTTLCDSSVRSPITATENCLYRGDWTNMLQAMRHTLARSAEPACHPFFSTAINAARRASAYVRVRKGSTETFRGQAPGPVREEVSSRLRLGFAESQTLSTLQTLLIGG